MLPLYPYTVKGLIALLPTQSNPGQPPCKRGECIRDTLWGLCCVRWRCQSQPGGGDWRMSLRIISFSSSLTLHCFTCLPWASIDDLLSVYEMLGLSPHPHPDFWHRWERLKAFQQSQKMYDNWGQNHLFHCSPARVEPRSHANWMYFHTLYPLLPFTNIAVAQKQNNY